MSGWANALQGFFYYFHRTVLSRVSSGHTPAELCICILILHNFFLFVKSFSKIKSVNWQYCNIFHKSGNFRKEARTAKMRSSCASEERPERSTAENIPYYNIISVDCKEAICTFTDISTPIRLIFGFHTINFNRIVQYCLHRPPAASCTQTVGGKSVIFENSAVFYGLHSGA